MFTNGRSLKNDVEQVVRQYLDPDRDDGFIDIHLVSFKNDLGQRNGHISVTFRAWEKENVEKVVGGDNRRNHRGSNSNPEYSRGVKWD